MKRFVFIVLAILLTLPIALAEERPHEFSYTMDTRDYTPLYISYMGLFGYIPYSIGYQGEDRYILHYSVSQLKLNDYIRYLQKLDYSIASDTSVTSERTIVFTLKSLTDQIPTTVTLIYNAKDESLHIVYPMAYEEKARLWKEQLKQNNRPELDMVKEYGADLSLSVKDVAVVNSYSVISDTETAESSYPFIKQKELFLLSKGQDATIDGQTVTLTAVQPKEDVEFVLVHMYLHNQSGKAAHPNRFLILLNGLLVNDALHYGRLKLLENGTYALDTTAQISAFARDDIWIAFPVLTYQWNSNEGSRRLCVSFGEQDGQRLDEMLSFGI